MSDGSEGMDFSDRGLGMVDVEMGEWRMTCAAI